MQVLVTQRVTRLAGADRRNSLTLNELRHTQSRYVKEKKLHILMRKRLHNTKKYGKLPMSERYFKPINQMSKIPFFAQITFLSLVLLSFVAFVVLLMLTSFTVGAETDNLVGWASIAVVSTFANGGLAFIAVLIEEELGK